MARVTWFPLLLAGLYGAAPAVTAVGAPASTTPTPAAAASPAAITPEQSAFFETRIRPVLIKNCYGCHGAAQKMSGLRLDSREAILKGGENGPSMTPGSPEKSTLISAIHYNADLKMPPAGKLKAAEIQDLTDWIKMGAPWPAATGADAVKTTSAPDYVITPAQQAFWSFQPVHKPALPAVKNSAWIKSPIDRFVLSVLEEKKLKPAPPADRRTLIRRAYFDLIGLPPTPDEVNAFLNDASPTAFAKVVDKLLESPHYGERWGRRWLDVARYADSNGLDENLAFGNAFRYRDYVVNAFNKDKPYNQFIQEQIAGDLLPAETPEIRNEHLIATGFLCLGAKVLAEQDKPKLEMDIIDEQIEVTSKAILGLTVACARCHDHKFDPIPTKDYYALAGIFKSTKTMENLGFVSRVMERPLASPEVEAQIKAANEKVKALKEEEQHATDAANNHLAEGFRKDAGRYWLAARELASQPGLSPAAERVQKPGDPDRLIIEAEKYDRGNAHIDFETYGKGIGIIHTTAIPTTAEWDITLPAAGNYQLDLRYAAAESRPIKLLVNGKVVLENAAAGVTGSWQPEGQKWETQGIFTFAAGKNTVKIERDGDIPHIDKLLVVSAAAPDAKPGVAPARTAEQLAAAYHLNPQALRQTAKFLQAFPNQDALAAWPQAAALSAADFDTEAGKLAQKIGTDSALAPLSKAAADGSGPFILKDKPEQYYSADDAAAVKKAGETVKTAEAAVPTVPMALAVDEGKVENVKVHIRGSTLNLGDEVPRHFLTILGGDKIPPIDDKHSGRLELAKWLSDASNPLTTRVVVNRLWQGHFGNGIARMTDNFGKQGEHPDNPQLLDWLTATFVENGWSMKQMHRMIMLSSTYQQSCAPNEKAELMDPEDRLMWRVNRRRLEAEPFRDAILSVSGKLDPALGGNLLTTPDNGYVTNDQSGNAANYSAPRRSIYLPVIRNAVFDMFQAFDFGDPSLVNAQRAATTVAPQALYIMNSPFVLEQSRSFAHNLLADAAATDAARVEKAYLQAFGRPPAPAETARALAFLDSFSSRLTSLEPDTEKRRLRTWQAFCQVIFASNEFIYIN